MTNRFEWQTEEEDGWADGGLPSKERWRRRRWPWLVAVVAAFVLASSVVFWQVRERISAAEAARADDILSSYHLIQQAIDDEDTELFRNLLSGRDAEWAMAQQELFSRDWLYDLSAFGLRHHPAERQEAKVVLSPELNSGEVSAVSTYALHEHGSNLETIRLQRTSVFRRGERWVWSPPRDEFWGGSSLARGDYLVVSYPDRDEQIALRLQRDLDGIVTQLCSEPDRLICPTGLEVHLALSRKPTALLEVNEHFSSQGLLGTRLEGRLDGRLNGSGRLEMTMPTPSLIGLPSDEPGYRALLRGYATYLATGLSNRLIDVECCGTEARYRAALQVLLDDLGLQRWPAAMIETANTLEERPAENQVALLCSDGFDRSQRMFLLDLERGQWQQAPIVLEAQSIKGIPDGEGVLVLGQATEDNRIRSQVWTVTPNGERLVHDEIIGQDEADGTSWEIQERPGRLVISFPDAIRGYSRYITIDLGQCLQGDCQQPVHRMANRPVWSPEGERSLVREFGLLWRRQGTSLVPVADGTAAFWLDEQTFGYARSVGRQQSVVVTSVDESVGEQVVLTTEELLRAFDRDERPARLLIGRILVSPDETLPWHILVFDVDRSSGVGQAHLVAYAPETNQVTLTPHSGRLMSFNKSPNGQWMAAAGYDEDEGRWLISVTDMRLATTVEHRLESGGSAAAVPSYSWSADEAWLLILEQGLLTLFNPETDSFRRVVPPAPGCVQAAWYGTAQPDVGDE